MFDKLRFVGPLLHRIVTTRAKRLTAQQSPNRHARSLDCAVPFNRFARIFRTGRHESARRRQPRRDYRFVELQERNQNKPHLWSAVASAARHRFGFARGKSVCFKVKAPSPLRSAGALQIKLVAHPAQPAQQSYETHESEVLQSNSRLNASH